MSGGVGVNEMGNGAELSVGSWLTPFLVLVALTLAMLWLSFRVWGLLTGSEIKP